MEGVILTREGLGQVWIALPVGLRVAVGQPGPAISIAAAETPMRQWIGVGVPNRLSELFVPGEIPLLPFRIAPLAGRIPMPRLDHQFSILTIGNCLPSRSENFPHHWLT